jgi:hypothetical protein
MALRGICSSQRNEENQLQRLSIPTRDYSTGDLALPAVHPELARRRRLAGKRGIMVSYESIRRWVNHFGPMIAADLRERRPKPDTSWHQRNRNFPAGVTMPPAPLCRRCLTQRLLGRFSFLTFRAGDASALAAGRGCFQN